MKIKTMPDLEMYSEDIKEEVNKDDAISANIILLNGLAESLGVTDEDTMNFVVLSFISILLNRYPILGHIINCIVLRKQQR